MNISVILNKNNIEKEKDSESCSILLFEGFPPIIDPKFSPPAILLCPSHAAVHAYFGAIAVIIEMAVYLPAGQECAGTVGSVFAFLAFLGVWVCHFANSTGLFLLFFCLAWWFVFYAFFLYFPKTIENQAE